MIFILILLKDIKTFSDIKTELKWIQVLQTRLTFNTRETFLKCLILMYFLFRMFVSVMEDFVVNVKMVI